LLLGKRGKRRSDVDSYKILTILPQSPPNVSLALELGRDRASALASALASASALALVLDCLIHTIQWHWQQLEVKCCCGAYSPHGAKNRIPST